MKLKLSVTYLLAFLFFQTKAQQILSVDASKVNRELRSEHLKMGNSGPKGRELLLNNWYMTIGGKPTVPVMGEVHFSRYPRQQWEDIILKMKANGITIIASYVLWIHHEEIEGQFDWSGNKDLRYFTKLCQKNGMLFYPRLGPWCHAEVRNGATPDWILEKKYLTDRSNDPVYQHYVDRLYGQIGQQLKGLYYKDGGPIVGVQLENEYRKGKSGEAHILWLKQTALKHGIDVPLYTVTGWDNASVPANGEVIPLYGGYPEAPWASTLDQAKSNVAFEMEERRDDDNIGNEMGTKKEANGVDFSKYPFFTCELGVGNQITYHRRPILNPIDGLSIATAKIASGSNLPGYYVFAGGTNPIGLLSTLEENQDETGYWNEYPDLSYDFQAAIRETGEIAPSYHQVKKLHYFLKNFGDVLAPSLPVIGQVQSKTTNLQYAVRTGKAGSFLFGLNYYRHFQKEKLSNVQFSVQLKDQTLVFPSQGITIPDSAIFIWPIKMNFNGLSVNYATATLLGKIQQKERTDWILFQQKGIAPELSLDAQNITQIDANQAKVVLKNGAYVINNLKVGLNGTSIQITTKDGIQERVVILSPEEANQIWQLEEQGRTHWFISEANLYVQEGKLKVFSNKTNPKITVLSEGSELLLPKKSDNKFTEYQLSTKAVTYETEIKNRSVLANSECIKVSVDAITSKNELWHKAYIKEFSLTNPAAIKSAQLICFTEIAGKIILNKTTVNQELKTGMINYLDVTGYVKKGNNDLLIDFPFEAGTKGFLLKLVIEYVTTDKVEFNSDGSWSTLDRYVLPTLLSPMKGLKPVELLAKKEKNPLVDKEISNTYTVQVKGENDPNLSALYLKMNYIGDKARCRVNYRLIADDFNNGTAMAIDLYKMGDQFEIQPLQMELSPLKPNYKIRFEQEPAKDDLHKTAIKQLVLVPEYQWTIGLN